MTKRRPTAPEVVAKPFSSALLASLEGAFWQRVAKSEGPSECWEWQGSITNRGYGRLGRDGKEYAAHRLSYALHSGGAPTDLLVCHTCDNPICVNPRHLYLGTNADNQRDRHARGRSPWSSIKNQGCPRLRPGVRRKLDWDQVRQIRQSTDRAENLAHRFDVARSTIHAIKQNRIWKEGKSR